MNTRESLESLEKSVEYFLDQLEGIEEEQLFSKPSEEEWSLGQLYVHLIQSTRNMSSSIELCREGTHESVVIGGTRSSNGDAVILNGGFPDIRIHVPPSPFYTPQQPKSKAELAEGLRVIVLHMREIEPTLGDIPVERTLIDPNFGGLSAVDWFHLAAFHFRHHLKQLRRLLQFAGVATQ
jgi:hypothetical protein